MCNLRMAQSALRKVFVYGTLKKGEPNHYWLTDTKNGYAKFFARATTTKKMPLVIATRYNIPFLLNKPGTGKYVVGEVYEVDEQMMDRLDNLEDCPNLYQREVQDMNIGIGEGKISCWIYLLNKYPDKLLNLDQISDYSSARFPYTERSKRAANFSAIDDLTYKKEAVN